MRNQGGRIVIEPFNTQIRALTLSAMALVLVLAVPTRAQANPDLSADVSVFNKYLWRGAVLSDGAVAQPEVKLGLANLELGVWSNLDLNRSNERRGQFSEVDYSASYTLTLHGTGLSAGVLEYSYLQHDVPAATEVTFGVTSKLPAAPSITIYQGVDGGARTYASLGLSQSLPIRSKSLDGALAIGWGSHDHNEYNYGVPAQELTDINFTLTSDLDPVPGISLRPTLEYSRMLGTDLRAACDCPDNLVFGIVLTRSF